MNAIGALVLVLSGAVLLSGLLLNLMGLSYRQYRAVFRSLVLARFFPALERQMFRPLYHGTGILAQSLFRSSRIPFRPLALVLSRQALYSNAILTALAFLVLCIQMIRMDLSNVYVVNNSAIDLPLFFRITGTWAGSAGSLLFWYALLAFFSAVCLLWSGRKLGSRQPHLIFMLIVMQLLFVLLNIFFEDAQSFREYPVSVKSGRGINPLLLHWGMIIHPPVLYLGYVGFAIPFAIVMAVLLSGNTAEDYLPVLRRWTIFAWFFLGTGILLGSKWAYEELGWGGYWAWDPVENASLMPFLFGTAFLHSLIVQERRGMLRFWNVFLIVMAYHFCLLGTWITRSGILEGPHSFAESSIGPPFILYLLLSLVFCLRFLYFRRAALRPRGQIESLTSKEGSMLFNNLIMTVSVLIVLFGVFSQRLPFDCRFDQGFACFATEWKPSAYNRIMIPIGLFTLFLMGASPLLTWRKGASGHFVRTLLLPLVSGTVAFLCFFFTADYFFPPDPFGSGTYAAGSPGLDRFFAAVTAGLCVFTVIGLIKEYIPAVRLRRNRYAESYPVAFVRVVLRNKRRYGGYLVHLSIVFLFIGYSGSAFKTTEQLKFQYYLQVHEGEKDYVHYRSQDRAYVKGYELTARDLFFKPEHKKNARADDPVHFTISQSAHIYAQDTGSPRRQTPAAAGDPLTLAESPAEPWKNWLKFTTGFILDGRMKTERHFHPRINPLAGAVERRPDGSALHIPTSKPDIRSTWSEDLYIQLGSLMDAATNRNPEWNHLYEYYYFFTDRSAGARQALFPPTLLATIEIWINPLVKFIWLGSVLFFLGGLILWLPVGEKSIKE
ncbi:MAG: cytochrome c biogenesis protein CcsA [Spirochaetales bacterium]|nr:cytochrome c biogenesis protein CcsA [Spirochaetales bacterium]